MHKVKKKVKSGKIPKPIKIKKEKTEEDRGLHPMSHYIDDRLELVKQIFGSLKQKTITNLAPDFLKKKSMDDIEELCLNELLGISTKRLLSIINATKCPTDTESSGESDVEHQEEHISLEEISSDSELEGSSGKKRSGVTKGKTGAKKTTKNSTENDENNGQISVLELLELQARARAIRSQLALEPVTKIEVDSDGEKNDSQSREQNSTNGYDSKEHKRKRRHESSERTKEIEKQRTSSTSQSRPPTSVRTSKTTTNSTADAYTNAKSKGTEADIRSTKEDKLKRNYRTKNPESDMAPSKTSRSIFERLDNPPIEVKKELIKEVKKEPRSHSPTPDVIPIVPEPETLLITDSSDGENDGTGKKKIRKMESAKNKSDLPQKDDTKKDASKDEQEKPTRDRKTTERDGGHREADKAEKEKSIRDRKLTERDATQREADKAEKERPARERKMGEKDGAQREAEKENSTRERKMIEKDGTQKEADKAETERSTRERKITEKSGNQGEADKTEAEKATKERKMTEKSREQREAGKAEIEKSTRERKMPEKGTGEKVTPKAEKDKAKSKRERRLTTGSGELVERQMENSKENVENKSQTNGNNTVCAPKNAPPKADEQTTERSIKTENKTSATTPSTPPADTPQSPTVETTAKSSSSSNTAKLATQPSNSAPALEDEDDRNDDVISLGGDLEKEMIEHLEEDAKPKTSSFANSTKKSKNVREENDSDIISLDSSESEVERDKESSESWHQRYLKSSKVSKVLAESRLGKRVRDNIKMSKRSQKDAERVKGSEDKEKSKTSYTSKHEDGSIDQYRELMAMRQRKRQQKKST